MCRHRGSLAKQNICRSSQMCLREVLAELTFFRCEDFVWCNNDVRLMPRCRVCVLAHEGYPAYCTAHVPVLAAHHSTEKLLVSFVINFHIALTFCHNRK